MALANFLKQSATITVEADPTPPQSALGGADRTTRLAVASGVPCLVRPLSSTLSALSTRRNDARANVADVRIYFDADPAPGGVSTLHWIEVDGSTYKVTGVVNPNSMGEIYHVDCETVRR